MELRNKTILITGGSSGIGLAAIPHFLNEGMRVLICGRNTDKNNLIRKKFPEVLVFDCDITKENEVYLLHGLISSIGGIDMLYNNAAVIHAHDLIKDHQSSFDWAADEISTNYLAIIRLNSLFLEMLQQKTEAAIINTTSAVAYVPAAIIPTYSSSKAALHSYTVSLRQQLQNTNSSIKVFELIPPTVDTDTTKNSSGKKVSTETVVRYLLKGLKKNNFTIQVSIVKMLYVMNRFFPSRAYKIINQ